MLQYEYKEKCLKTILKWSQNLTTNADNVRTCILRVMNMDHTEKRSITCSKRKKEDADHGCFPFRTPCQESTFGRLK